MKTYLIVPAWSDQAGQCRIVVTSTFSSVKNPIRDYRDYGGDKWREAGIMNSQGKLVCLDATPEQRKQIAADEPLSAGMSWEFP
jgi:hypothetical protein